MAIRPLHDRGVVRRIEAESRSAAGIVIPDAASGESGPGEVVAVGPRARPEDGSVRPVAIQPGDRVLFGTYAGSDVKLDGEALLVIEEPEILAVIRRRKRWRQQHECDGDHFRQVATNAGVESSVVLAKVREGTRAHG